MMKKQYVSPVLDTQLVEFSGCLMGSTKEEPPVNPEGAPTPMPGAPKKA